MPAFNDPSIFFFLGRMVIMRLYKYFLVQLNKEQFEIIIETG